MKDWEQWAWDVLYNALMFVVGFNLIAWAIVDLFRFFE